MPVMTWVVMAPALGFEMASTHLLLKYLVLSCLVGNLCPDLWGVWYSIVCEAGSHINRV